MVITQSTIKLSVIHSHDWSAPSLPPLAWEHTAVPSEALPEIRQLAGLHQLFVSPVCTYRSSKSATQATADAVIRLAQSGGGPGTEHRKLTNSRGGVPLCAALWCAVC